MRRKTPELECIEVGRGKPEPAVTFADLMSPVVSQLRKCYWLASRDIILGRSTDGELMTEKDLSSLIIRRSQHWLLTRPELGWKYSRFVNNDWCEIIGLRASLNEIGEIEPDRRFIEEWTEIYFKCIDGAYWVAISPRGELISLIKKKLSSSVDVTLADLKPFIHWIRSEGQ